MDVPRRDANAQPLNCNAEGCDGQQQRKNEEEPVNIKGCNIRPHGQYLQE